MKKLFFVFLALLLILCGCSEEKLPETPNVPEKPEIAEDLSTEEADGEEFSEDLSTEEPAEPQPDENLSMEEPAEPKPKDNPSTEEPTAEEIPVVSAEGPIVYTPKAGEKPKQLSGHIESEFYVCRLGMKEAVGLTADEAAAVLALLESADENDLWGDPYDDLPDYELWFADGRVLTFSSDSGIFTNNSAQKAFMISDADRENITALFKSAVKRATGED